GDAVAALSTDAGARPAGRGTVAAILAEAEGGHPDDDSPAGAGPPAGGECMSHEATLIKLRGFAPDGFTTPPFRANLRIIVQPDRLYPTLEFLKMQAGFDMLADVTAVDYLHYPDARDRFGLIYALLNTNTGERVYVKTHLNEPELTVRSAFPLWKGADWL